jgi:hypothetical protein
MLDASVLIIEFLYNIFRRQFTSIEILIVTSKNTLLIGPDSSCRHATMAR